MATINQERIICDQAHINQTMKDWKILMFEVVISVAVMAIGLSGHKILFIKSARSAVFCMGIIGALLCTLSVGKFISQSPAHILSIMGYIIGTVLIVTLIVQIFKLSIPVLSNAKAALIILGVGLILKGFIGRFYYLIIK